jgi:CubicO group peptidase (beta-lactamase class C family)
MSADSLACRLKEILENNLNSGLEVGASVAVWRGAEIVAQVHCGYADAAKTKPWTDETMVLIWSATKGPAVACVLHALDEAGLDLSTRMVEFWPEFGGAGKDAITVGEVLSHRAGVSAIEDGEAMMLDHDSVVRAVEKQVRLWPSGDGHAYGPRVFGFLLDEMVRRLSGGETLAERWNRVFREPNALDLWIGLPAEYHGRVAQMLPPKAVGCPDGTDPFAEAMGDPSSLTRRAFALPGGLLGVTPMNSPAARSASIPSFGGIGTARALARFYSGLATGEFAGAGVVAWASNALSQAIDWVLCVETCFSAGFMKDPVDAAGSKKRQVFGPNSAAFGQPGAGGSLGFGDPSTGIGFAYVMNQMQPGVLPGRRAVDLVAAVYEALAN